MSDDLATTTEPAAGPSGEFEVTITARARHGILLRAIREWGGVAGLAREIGVNSGTLGQWVNLKATPGRRKNYNGHESVYMKKTVRAAVAKLCQICKCRAQDLFPDWLTKERLRATTTTIEFTRSVAATSLSDLRKEVALLEAPSNGDLDAATQLEVRELLDRAIDSLTYREREVLKLRYGLGDGYAYTLEECGRIFRITRERVCQTELRALHKLQHSVRCNELKDYAGVPGGRCVCGKHFLNEHAARLHSKECPVAQRISGVAK